MWSLNLDHFEVAEHRISTLSWLHIREDIFSVSAWVVYICACAHMCVHTWVEARGRYQIFSLVIFHLILETGPLSDPRACQMQPDSWLEKNSGPHASNISWTLGINSCCEDYLFLLSKLWNSYPKTHRWECSDYLLWQQSSGRWSGCSGPLGLWSAVCSHQNYLLKTNKRIWRSIPKSFIMPSWKENTFVLHWGSNRLSMMQNC